MSLANGLAGAGAVSAVLYLLAFCWAGPSAVKSVVKTVSVGALAAVAWLAGAPWLLALALTLGALGDFFLSRDGDRAFLAGLVAFALAHLAYVPLFLTTPGFDIRAYAGWRGALVVLFTLYAVWLARKLWRGAGDLRGAVMVYIAIILAMVAASLGLPLPIVWAAAGLFALSDTILSAQFFLMREDHPLRTWTSYAIWATYWPAQALFLFAYL